LSTEIDNRIISCIEERIRETIARSPVTEDPEHAENTLEWVLKLHPKAGQALKIAALGHDIERAVPPRVRREDYGDYDTFKRIHAARSAEILAKIMEACGAGPGFVEEVTGLVKRHETGGTPEADILNQADSLSFFETNIGYFYEREGRTATEARVLWGLRRLPKHILSLVPEMKYPVEELEILVKSCLNKITKHGELFFNEKEGDIDG